MNLRSRILPLHLLLGVLLLAAAAAVRAGRLDWPPMNDAEAAAALTAAGETDFGARQWQGTWTSAARVPAYEAMTAIAFEFAPVNEVVARSIPAMFGIGLIALPLLMAPGLGAAGALMLVALLAFSPLLVTASRTASGLSIAMAGLGLAAAHWAHRRTAPRTSASLWAAAGLGVAAASGVSGFIGLLGLAVGLLATRVIWRDRMNEEQAGWGRPWLPPLTAVAAFLVVASGIGFFPGGIAGASHSLTAWLAGWITPGPVRGLTVLFALPIYEPLLLVFGLAGAVVALRRKDPVGRTAVVWAAAAILLALIYPAREVSDVAWAILPLSYLGAVALSELIDAVTRHWSLQGHGGLIVVLLLLGAMSSMQVAAFASGIGPAVRMADPGLSLIVAIVALLLGGVIVVLFGMGWSWSIALEGAGIAALIGLIALDLSAIWSLNFRITAAGANELWRPQAAPRSLAAVRETVERISQARTGRTDRIPIQFDSEPGPALVWALRQFPPADTGETAEPPEVVLAPAEADLSTLRADYIGQQIIVSERWGWDGILPPDPVTWWAHHEGPAVQDVWLLLVRVDVATLGGLTELPEEAP